MTTEVIITNLGPSRIMVKGVGDDFRREIGVRATAYINTWDGGPITIEEIKSEVDAGSKS